MGIMPRVSILKESFFFSKYRKTPTTAKQILAHAVFSLISTNNTLVDQVYIPNWPERETTLIIRQPPTSKDKPFHYGRHTIFLTYLKCTGTFNKRAHKENQSKNQWKISKNWLKEKLFAISKKNTTERFSLTTSILIFWACHLHTWHFVKVFIGPLTDDSVWFIYLVKKLMKEWWRATKD